MIKELNLNCPYKVYEESNTKTYYFDTNSGIRYVSYFTDANEYFVDFHLRHNIFTFGFEPKKNANSIIKKFEDVNIRLTLIAILEKFFENKSNVLTFVSDISDFKQKARNRLFEIWKNEFDTKNEFEKYDVEIETSEETYYSSMLIHKDNIHKLEYKSAFLMTTNDYNK